MTTPDQASTPGGPDAPVHAGAAAAPPPPETVGDVVRKLGPAAVLAGIASVLPALGSIALLWNINRVGEWLRGHGDAGIGVYSLGFAVFAGLALLPTYSSAFLGGWAFGFGVGYPAALAGFLGGSLIAYAIARPTASARVDMVLAAHPKWSAVRDALLGGSPARTLGIVMLMRLPPNSPFALTNLVLASARVPLWIYVVGTLVGMAPRTGIMVYIASTLRDQMADKAAEKPLWLVVAGFAVSILVLVLIGLIAKHALARMTRAA